MITLGDHMDPRQRQLWILTKYIYSSTVPRLIFKYLYFAQVFPYSATLGSFTHFHMLHLILDSA